MSGVGWGRGGLMSGSRYQTSTPRNEGSPLLYTTNTVYGPEIPSHNKHFLENSNFRPQNIMIRNTTLGLTLKSINCTVRLLEQSLNGQGRVVQSRVKITQG